MIIEKHLIIGRDNTTEFNEYRANNLNYKRNGNKSTGHRVPEMQNA
jgi:hypothetical protein